MKRNTLFTALVGFLGAVLWLPLCSADDDIPLVLVSVAPQAYFLNKVAGEAVRVEILIPANADPHSYEPNIGQLRLLEQAALYFSLRDGFPYEKQWEAKVGAEKTLRTASDCKSKREHDPHVWLSFECAKSMAGAMAQKLGERFPQKRGEFEARLRDFETEIETLRGELTKQLSAVRRRSFLVYHPAWGHFCDQFGLEQVALEHEGKEPDAFRIQQIIVRAKREGMKNIFVEPQLPQASAAVVARELGGKVIVADPQPLNWAEGMRSFATLLATELQ